jgi:hypothetical protein
MARGRLIRTKSRRNTEIRGRTSKVLLPRGEFTRAYLVCTCQFANANLRFGWVNASYVYGLQIVNTHMKRALGTVTTWDRFKTMTDAANAGKAPNALNNSTTNGPAVASVRVAPFVYDALPHSHDDQAAHSAMHDTQEREEHRSPSAKAHSHN